MHIKDVKIEIDNLTSRCGTITVQRPNGNCRQIEFLGVQETLRMEIKDLERAIALIKTGIF